VGGTGLEPVTPGV